MEFLENKELKIAINPKGAELTSLYDKRTNTEYMWSGDPVFWAKHSPVLFPIVGTLKDDTYYYEGRSYRLSRHGFAREMPFTVADKTENSITFSLVSSTETIQKFPFSFRFYISYLLQNKSLSVKYYVINGGTRPMYFSVGAHPAFKVPVAEGTAYDDYYLEFEKDEDAGRWPISKNGLIEAEPVKLLSGKKLPLTKPLFYGDALVLKHLKSQVVSLKSDKADKGFNFQFSGFPFLGIWAAKDADFVCIEPWCGIADSVNTNQDFTQKEGINKLEAGGVFERAWTVEVF
ncbi:MAG: aldose 1-epimerase family protein [Chitinophagaceae bacterium]|nr:aldose 1-epimerase family protein [Chitinophagaceae bacterium]